MGLDIIIALPNWVYNACEIIIRKFFMIVLERIGASVLHVHVMDGWM